MANSVRYHVNLMNIGSSSSKQAKSDKTVKGGRKVTATKKGKGGKKKQMAKGKPVYSGSVGNPWHGIKPNIRKPKPKEK